MILIERIEDGRDLALAERIVERVVDLAHRDPEPRRRGAIDDEIGAYEGTIVRVDAKGLLPAYDDIDKDSHNAKDKLRDYFQRENGGKTIEALWSPSDPDCSWAYKTDIPHETFDIMEDGELYCRGIVFRLADVG